MTIDNVQELWEKQLKQWKLFGPPLRPVREDLDFLQREITDWISDHKGRPARVLVLGVTPEVPALEWPVDSRVYAVDKLANMIKFVWPASQPFAAGAVIANWLQAPFARECVDFIIGDGSFTLVPWPEGYRKVLVSITDTLVPDGVLMIRFFVRPAQAESPDAVFSDLMANRIANFHVFKWRLAMSLYQDEPAGVCVGDIWNTWKRRGLAENQVVSITGWPAEVVHTIHSYRDSIIRYTFPKVDELRNLLAETMLEIACHIPGYELGERCPTIALRRV